MEKKETWDFSLSQNEIEEYKQATPDMTDEQIIKIIGDLRTLAYMFITGENCSSTVNEIRMMLPNVLKFSADNFKKYADEHKNFLLTTIGGFLGAIIHDIENGTQETTLAAINAMKEEAFEMKKTSPNKAQEMKFLTSEFFKLCVKDFKKIGKKS